MKNIAIASLLIVFLSSCSEMELNKIDTNPNAPTDVPLKQLLPQVTMNTVYAIAGGYTAKGVSTYVEHTTSVRLNTIDPPDVNESLWTRVYYGLNDLNRLMEKARAEGNLIYLGIAQVLYAHDVSQLTDMYGDVPLSEAVLGSENRTPKFDTQEDIYKFIINLLDEAIVNLDDTSGSNPMTLDLIFGGDITLWKKTAYGLKARLYNRQSVIDPQGSATLAIAAAAKSFANQDEGFIFKRYSDGTAYDNPWSGIQNSQELFAVSSTVLNVMEGFSGTLVEDPRSEKWFSKIGDRVVGAPSGTSAFDQGHLIYSQPSRLNVLFGAAHQPLLTFDEVKFIEAEAQLRLNNNIDALVAYKIGIQAAMGRAGVSAPEVEKYLLKPTALPAADSLTIANIIGQKYLAFWIYQPFEAFNDYRRTGYPLMNNPKGTIKRLPYPNSEVSRNPNTPSNINATTMYTIPVWWAKK